MTGKQSQLMQFLLDFHAKNDNFPSFREIMAHLEYKSPRSAMDEMNALEKQGLIENYSTGTYAKYRFTRVKNEG